MRRAVALAAVGLAASLLAACAQVTPEGRDAPPVTVAFGASDQTKDIVDLPAPPETYGLPPLEQLRADPYGVAVELSHRSLVNPWTVKWKVTAVGEEGGSMTLSHIPAAGDRSNRIHAAGFVDAGEGNTLEVAVLDDGYGARACMRKGTQPFVCDKKDYQAGLQFLSVQSLADLTGMLGDAMAKPGAAVVYKMIAGEPSTCFLFPPAPVTRSTLGLDFSNGGVYCLSRVGAIMKIETATTSLDAVEYSPDADPSTFRLPV